MGRSIVNKTKIQLQRWIEKDGQYMSVTLEFIIESPEEYNSVIGKFEKHCNDLLQLEDFESFFTLSEKEMIEQGFIQE